MICGVKYRRDDIPFSLPVCRGGRQRRSVVLRPLPWMGTSTGSLRRKTGNLLFCSVPPVAAAPPVGEMLVAFIRNGCLALRVGGVPGGGAGVGGCSCDALSGEEDTLVHLSGRCTLSSNE